jgi:phosphoserine aminotransferase
MKFKVKPNNLPYNRVFNFAAGPAALPLEVLQQIQDELFNWQDTGVSLMELSHRSKQFMQLAEASEQLIRDLLAVPSNYKVLFLGGSARVHFSMIPMNILGGKRTADYIDTGFWSKIAITEAQKYCTVNTAISSSEDNIPPESRWQLTPNAAYVYYTANETIDGIEFQHIPQCAHAPLVSDMTSNFLAYPLDVSKFGIIFAGTQKNIGIGGLSVVIIRDDLLDKAMPHTPMAYDYRLQAEKKSLLTTPPTFPWYVTYLMLQWIKAQGGLNAMAEINQRKAKKLYQVIDNSALYQNAIHAECRSRMNVVFTLADSALDSRFLEEAGQRGLQYLKGHRCKGGMRASIYNGVSEQGVDNLIEFMQQFEQNA